MSNRDFLTHRSSYSRRLLIALAFAVLGGAPPAKTETIKHYKSELPAPPSVELAVRNFRNERSGPSAPTVLQLSSGTYHLTRTIVLGPEFSGTPDAPVIIRGATDGSTRVVGTRKIAPTSLALSQYGELPSGVKAQVIDLTKVQGVKDPRLLRRGAYIGIGQSGFELFQGNIRLHPSRWPKNGFSRSAQPGASSNSSQSNTIISIPKDLFERWKDDTGIWFGGYWTQDWAYELLPVDQFANDGQTVILPALKARGKVRSGFRYFIQNAMSELSAPGEYVLDSTNNRAVVAQNDNAQDLEVATVGTLLEIKGAHDIIVENIALEKALGTVLRVNDSENITVRNCFVGRSGASGISINGGRNVLVDRCVIRDTAETGIAIQGGDRTTLTASGHAVTNTIITDFGIDSRTYRPAIQMKGVGNRIEGCSISGGPHSAIILSGNDHLIKNNEIHNVVKETDDAGAIYIGRDWTERGNVIEGNFVHDVGVGRKNPDGSPLDASFVSGIYLDDQESGFSIRNNVFLRVSRPIVIHGGRDNVIENNAFLLSSHGAIWLHKRGEGLSGGELERKLKAVPYRDALWAARYPSLAAIIEQDPASPLNNSEANNLVRGGALLDFLKPADEAYWPHRSKTTVDLPASPTILPQQAERLAAAMLAEAGGRFANQAVADRMNVLNTLLYASH